MYIPPANRVEDLATIRAFMHSHGFATIVAHADGPMQASHVPVLLDESPSGDTLRGHMARANEQWRLFSPDREVLCIFPGPHSYISPSWYEAKVAVPTWNYATVHAYGRPRIETDPAFLVKVLNDTTSKYESKMEVPWEMAVLPEEYVSSMMKAVVAFSIEITRVEGKFKFGQNRSAADQGGMMAALDGSPDPESRMLAEFIRGQNGGPA
jgi:transcriptional regulator